VSVAPHKEYLPVRPVRENRKTSDALVIGESLAGISAALEMARRGLVVSVIDHPFDTLSIRGTRTIGVNELLPTESTGEQFASFAQKALLAAGVTVVRGGHAQRLLVGHERIFASFWDNNLLTAKVVVFAPNGTEPGVAENIGFERLSGFGASWDAWSDAFFYKGQPVCVIGSGARALDQALIASDKGANVTVLWEEKRISAEHRGVLGSIPVVEDVALLELLADSQGNLSTLRINVAGVERSIAACALFSAHEPNVSHFLLPASSLSLVVRAGLVNGIAHSDHAGLVLDGIRAGVAATAYLHSRDLSPQS